MRQPYYAYDVTLDGKWIDTIFISPSADGRPTDVDEVRRSLIDHDGYDPDIEVVIA